MIAVFVSAVSYLGIFIVAGFVCLNMFFYGVLSFDFDFSRYLDRFLLGLAAVTFLVGIVLPLLITPFSLLSDAAAARSRLSLFTLLRRTPQALLRAIRESFRAVFSATAIASPLIPLSFFTYKYFLSAELSFLHSTFLAFLFFLTVMICTSKVFGRLLYPLLFVSGSYSREESLSLATRFVKAKPVRLLLGSGLVVVLLALLQYFSPLRVEEARMLLDGSLFSGLNAELVHAIVRGVPYFFLFLLPLLFLSFSLSDSRLEQGRERFRSLLENNVSPYHIAKLANAGYFN